MKKATHVVLSTNVVILAQFHNPSILNPDFLKINKIVEKEWEVKEGITTNTFSQIHFHNGISITVDNEKFNISCKTLGAYPKDSTIYDVAKIYVAVLEHVKYTALGLNWEVAVPVKNPSSWLIDHFVKKNSIPKSGPSVEEIDLTMKFKKDGGVVSFSLSPGVLELKDKKPFQAVLIKTNTHYKINSLDKIIEILSGWEKALEFVKQQTDKLIRIK